MTVNQVAYLNYLETQRSNRENEKIKREQIAQSDRENRRNIAERLTELAISDYHQSVGEAENQRWHTLSTVADLARTWVQQQYNLGNLAIASRHEESQEYYWLGQLMESQRSNLSNEALKSKQISNQYVLGAGELQLGVAQLNEKSREYENTYNLDVAKFRETQWLNEFNAENAVWHNELELYKLDQKDEELEQRWIELGLQVYRPLSQGLSKGLGLGWDMIESDVAWTGTPASESLVPVNFGVYG